jgi:hypothetical protein
MDPTPVLIVPWTAAAGTTLSQYCAIRIPSFSTVSSFLDTASAGVLGFQVAKLLQYAGALSNAQMWRCAGLDTVDAS